MARILVADNDIDARDALTHLLRRAGHEVTAVADGEQALDLFRARPFDLVVLDLIMPKRSGLETIRLLKAQFPDVRTLVISGAWQIEGRDALAYARRVGADVALPKPADPDVVLRAVKELLALSS